MNCLHRSHRRGFTLVELLVVITIIGLVSAMLSSAMATSQRQALTRRAEAELLTYGTILQARIGGITFTTLLEKISRNRTNGFPGGLMAGSTVAVTVQQDLARTQMMLKRDYARMLLPNCRADLYLPPASFQRREINPSNRNQVQAIAVSNVVPREWNEMRALVGLLEASEIETAYQASSGTIRQPVEDAGIDSVGLFLDPSSDPTSASPSFQDICTSRPGRPAWTKEHESAECLYLILATYRQTGLAAIDNIPAKNIGDTDGDGVNEILDPWGTPVCFIREPVGMQGRGFSNFAPERAVNAPYADRASITEAAEAFIGTDPDPYDLLGTDFRYSVVSGSGAGTAPIESGTNPVGSYFPYYTAPVVVSAGADQEFGIYRPEDVPDFITSVSFTLSDPPTPLLNVGGRFMPYRFADPYFDLRSIRTSTVIESGTPANAFPQIFDARRGAGLGGHIGIADRVGDPGVNVPRLVAESIELATDNITSIETGL